MKKTLNTSNNQSSLPTNSTLITKRAPLTTLTSHLFAHRGLHGFYNLDTNLDESPLYIPENTLAAFQLAINNHLAIELDIHLTVDRELIVFHDNNTERLTQVSKKIKRTKLSELQALKISSHFSQSQSISPQISTYQIPTLKSALDLIAGQTPLLIELKSELFTDHHLFCQKTALILQEYQKQNRDAFVAIKSFDPRIILWFKYHFPEIPAGLLISSHPKALLLLGLLALNFPFNIWLQPDFISVDKKIVQYQKIQKYRKNHPVLCWTLHHDSLVHYQNFADNFIIE